MNLLKSRSAVRIQKSDRFKKMNETVAYLTKKRDETEIILNLEHLKKEDSEGETRSEELKYLIENKNILVSGFENSIKDSSIDMKDKKNWDEVQKQKQEEWVKTIQQDPTLEEGLSVAEDMIKLALGQKLSLSK